METKSRKLVLTFGTALNTEVNITISNPADLLEASAIKSAMDTIVTSGAVGEASPADKVLGAKYVIQQVDEVALA